MHREPLIWEELEIWTVPDMLDALIYEIETEEDAETFFEEYAKVCPDAEHNIGYLAGLIRDEDVQQDVLDLFMVELQIEPRQLFGGNSSYGIKIGDK